MRSFNNWLTALALVVFCGSSQAELISISPNGGGSSSAGGINIVTQCGASVSAADNATALQNCINTAVAQGKPLVVPSAGTTGCYKYTAPLTISGNLLVYGEQLVDNWNNGINVPLGVPPLAGSVLCPTSNGSDAIDISGTSLNVSFQNIGILFQTPFVGTGDGIHYVPAQNVQGVSGANWYNVKIYGHDGNHYAYNLTNPLLGTYTSLFSYGGGGFKLYGSSTQGQFGNITFVEPYCQVIVGGTADGFNIASDAGGHYFNLTTFVRPQCITDNIPGTTPAGNPPTSAQRVYIEDTNVAVINKKSPDFESNVGSGIFLAACNNNGLDFDNMNLGNLGGGINAPNWGICGIAYGGVTRTFNDTTGTGTIAVQAQWAIPGHTVTASNAVTYTDLAALYVGSPNAGTNVTAPTRDAIYANGAIKAAGGNGSLAAQAGLFVTGGTATLNNNSNFNTQFNTGNSTGTVTIGNATNTGKTILANIATDATHTTRSVCQDTTSNVLYFGSGTLGICLGTSSSRFKHDIKPLDAGLDQIMSLVPVAYRLNEDHGDPDKVLYGFTAEQGAVALPELSAPDAEGKPNTFDYLGVVPVLVKGMQQLKAENDNLRACNDNWKCRLFGVR